MRGRSHGRLGVSMGLRITPAENAGNSVQLLIQWAFDSVGLQPHLKASHHCGITPPCEAGWLNELGLCRCGLLFLGFAVAGSGCLGQ